MLQVYRSVFALRCQATVVTTTDPEVALRLAIAEPPDLFITDWNHPKLSGLLLIKRLRDEARTQSVPLWVISADAKRREADALEAGADMVMQKPVMLDDLAHRANQLFLKG